jgi:hypothetical protein
MVCRDSGDLARRCSLAHSRPRPKFRRLEAANRCHRPKATHHLISVPRGHLASQKQPAPPMKVSIAQLRAAGLSAEQILKMVEEAEADRREQNRIHQRNHRARQAYAPDTPDTHPALSLEVRNITKLKKEPRSKKTSLPDDWQPKGPQRDPTEADEFRDHARAKGWKYSDWEAAYRNFQKSAYNPRNKPGGSPQVVVDLEKERERQEYLAMMQKQRELAQKMRTQGASQDEITKALWTPEIAGRWASKPAQLGRTNAVSRNGGPEVER